MAIVMMIIRSTIVIKTTVTNIDLPVISKLVISSTISKYKFKQ
jgi:hypothetical protein